MLDSNLLVAHYNLACGDRIIRGESVFPAHRVIYVGIHHGVPMVAENPKGKGVQYISLDEFLLWGVATIERVERFVGTEEDRKQVVPNLNQLASPAKKGNTAGTALWGMSLLALLGGILLTTNE